MAAKSISAEERRSRLVRRHRLRQSERTDHVPGIVRDLVGLHSSDPATVYLSLAARMEHPSVTAISDSLYEDWALIRQHAMRRTLWVFTPELARVAHAAVTKRFIPTERKRLIKMLGQGTDVADPDEWLAKASEIAKAEIDRTGPVDTRTLGIELPDLRLPMQLAQGKSYAATVSGLSRVLLQLSFEASIVRGRPTGSWTSSQYQWERMPYNVSGEVDPIRARADLVRCWLDRFGPGTERDIAWWTGLPLGMVRAALEAIGAIRVDGGADVGWVNADDLEDEPPDTDSPIVALLPGLDPTTMGWKERDWYLDPAYVSRLFDSNGNSGPTVWVGGRIVGGWVQLSSGRVAYRLLEDVGEDAIRKIETEAERLESFWGETRFKIRFPAPLQSELYK